MIIMFSLIIGFILGIIFTLATISFILGQIVKSGGNLDDDYVTDERG